MRYKLDNVCLVYMNVLCTSTLQALFSYTTNAFPRYCFTVFCLLIYDMVNSICVLFILQGSRLWFIELYVLLLTVVHGSLSLCTAIRALRAVQGSLPFFDKICIHSTATNKIRKPYSSLSRELVGTIH